MLQPESLCFDSFDCYRTEEVSRCLELCTGSAKKQRVEQAVNESAAAEDVAQPLQGVYVRVYNLSLTSCPWRVCQDQSPTRRAKPRIIIDPGVDW